MAQIEELLEEIEEILAEGKGKAFSSRATIDVDALKTVLEDIRLSVPEEIKQARLLASERREIMNRANREAEAMIENAREKSRDLLAASEKRVHDNEQDSIRRNEELLRETQAKARSIIEAARLEAERIVAEENITREAKLEADRILAEAEVSLQETKQKSVELLAEAKKRADRIEREAAAESKAKMEAATKWSHDLKMNAGNFVEELVNETEYRVAKSLSEIQKLQDSLSDAAKKSSQASAEAEKRAAEARPEKSVRRKKPADNGMTEKHSQNLRRNERDMYGRRRKPLGESTLVEEDRNVQVIMPRPSLIDIPLDDIDYESMPIVPDEEAF